MEADVSRRTSHLLGERSAVSCQQHRMNPTPTGGGVEASGCDSQRLRVVNSTGTLRQPSDLSVSVSTSSNENPIYKTPFLTMKEMKEL